MRVSGDTGVNRTLIWGGGGQIIAAKNQADGFNEFFQNSVFGISPKEIFVYSSRRIYMLRELSLFMVLRALQKKFHAQNPSDLLKGEELFWKNSLVYNTAVYRFSNTKFFT